jgi:hypothetical protein
MSAFRFAGAGLASVLWLPLYRTAPPLGFAGPAVVLLAVVLPAVALWPTRSAAAPIDAAARPGRSGGAGR